ncbi:Wadjet anti-phage system protein JetD domain-containing protein [Ursidibacter sp. B-7004-1]
MLNWTTEKTIKNELIKRWEKGSFLSQEIFQESIFPLKLKLAKPTSADITSQFEQVRKWVMHLTSLNYLTIEWKTINHRIQGEQKIPERIYIADLETLLTLLNKKKEHRTFLQILQISQRIEPLVLPWLAKNALKSLALADDWEKLLSVVIWRKTHSKPHIYLRQVNIPDVHTKFIETHRTVLAELLDLVLDETEIQREYSGISQFVLRYGFLDKPKHIRLRNLDKGYPIQPSSAYSDIYLDSLTFSQLTPKIKKVFIIENEINFLSFPEIPHSWAIFGAGYGWCLLANATWLNQCQIYYWGDIDTHGFAILNQLRSYFPNAISFLMDSETLLAHKSFWSKEAKQQTGELQYLTEAENKLYAALVNNTFGDNVRLEQEFVGFDKIKVVLRQEGL